MPDPSVQAVATNTKIHFPKRATMALSMRWGLGSSQSEKKTAGAMKA